MGDAGDLYAANRADGFDPHEDIVAMPFSRFDLGNKTFTIHYS